MQLLLCKDFKECLEQYNPQGDKYAVENIVCQFVDLINNDENLIEMLIQKVM